MHSFWREHLGTMVRCGLPRMTGTAYIRLKEYLQPRLKRTLGGLLRRLQKVKHRLLGRPESTFIRVAYSVPRQVALITARHEGAQNVWPIDSHIVLSFQPGLYGICVNPGGYGAELVSKSGVFVVNFVPATWEKMIFYCGSVSGRQVDKLASSGLQIEEAESVNAPRLAQALGSLECRVRQTLEVGDHTLYVGEVMHTVMREEAPRLHHLDSRLEKISNTFE